MESEIITYIMLGVVSIGTIATVTILIRNVIRNKRKISVEVIETINPDTLENQEGPRRSITFIVKNGTVYPLNIGSIGLIDNNGSYHHIPLSEFGYRSARQIPVKEKSRVLLIMDYSFVGVLKGNNFEYAFIKDTGDNTNMTNLPKHIKSIFK